MKKKKEVNPIESRIELMEKLLKEAHSIIESVLVESNGISDNEWTIDRKKWKAIPAWPMRSYWASIKNLDKFYSKLNQYLKPIESERLEKWKEACNTASSIMKEYDQRKAQDGEKWASGELQRNIADAIYGVLRASEADLEDGIHQRTMMGKIENLVEDEKLAEIKTTGK
jgi:hypothetical protein